MQNDNGSQEEEDHGEMHKQQEDEAQDGVAA